MATYPSEITIEEVINKIIPFCPIAIYWNNECIWNDDADAKDWKSIGQALNEFYAKNTHYSDYMVTNVNISSAYFHHTIVHIYGYNRAAAG